MPAELFSGNEEPTVDELLDDKIASLLRARDGLDVIDVVRVIDRAKAALALRETRAWSMAE